jgi:hypothetical protein
MGLERQFPRYLAEYFHQLVLALRMQHLPLLPL